MPSACRDDLTMRAMSLVYTTLLSVVPLITLTVFVPFALFYMKEPLRLDFLWAALCLVGAAYFMFRASLGGS